MAETITSLQNPQVKTTAQLHLKKYRDETGLILVEGPHAVLEAVKSGVKIRTLYLREDAPELPPESLSPVPVSRTVMAKMATTESPPGMLAVAERPRINASGLFSTESVRLLGLLGVQEPGNWGNLIRSACAFGMTGCLLVGNTVDAYHPKAIRASAGLVFRLPVAELADWQRLEQLVRDVKDLVIWGADSHPGQSYADADFGKKTLLLLGAEGAGLPPSVWELARPLHIPMAPEAESLNVATAGAILMAELYRRQQQAWRPKHSVRSPIR